jgi:transketolase
MLARKRPTRQEFVAVNDTFGESATPAELMKKYKIDADCSERSCKKNFS